VAEHNGIPIPKRSNSWGGTHAHAMPAEREREKGPIQGEGPDQMHAPAACWDLSYPAQRLSRSNQQQKPQTREQIEKKSGRRRQQPENRLTLLS